MRKFVRRNLHQSPVLKSHRIGMSTNQCKSFSVSSQRLLFEFLGCFHHSSCHEATRERAHSGGFRGQMGATAPFTMKTKLWHPSHLIIKALVPRVWHPLFGKKSAPYPDSNALLFQCFVLNAGKHVN